MEKFLSCREYADMHGVSPQAVRQAISEGRIVGAQSIKLPGPARPNDHVWIIPIEAPYTRRRAGRKSYAQRIAEEQSNEP